MMKLKFLTLFLLVAGYSFSQSVNDYKAVVIPMKYDLQKTENQYRLQTITKMDLQKAGFQAFYTNETIPTEFQDRCSLLYIDVVKDSGFLTTKVYVTFKDCYGFIVFKSATGLSREKEYNAAYSDALNEAFKSVDDLNYTYNGNTNFSPRSGVTPQFVPGVAVPAVAAPVAVVPAVPAVVIPAVAVSTPKLEPKTVETNTKNLLYAQPTSYGYQLIDSEPKVVMKVYKTSNPASYMATKGTIQGALVAKDNQWFFEYYQNDKLISEKVEVKF
jgi:hypothetical protein